MVLCANRIRKILQTTACLALTAALALPLTAQSATQSQKGKRPVATKSTDKKSTAVARTHARKTAVAQAKRSTNLSSKRLAKNTRKKSATTIARSKGGKLRVASGKKSQRYTAAAYSRRAPVVRVSVPARLSMGERLGLRSSLDPLDLNSSVALVIDQDTHEVLFSKNDSAVLPIASLTKLMTGLVIADASLPMDESITITQDDVDTLKGSSSRLAVGTTLSRGELMHLALMSSENRAAHALGRTYPGGLNQFVSLMNRKAFELGMTDTRYVEPTGLSSLNQSSARDLATLVSVAYERPILRSLSTSPGYLVELGDRMLQFKNSNGLIRSPDWDIGLQKTGYISEAGRCLVMQAKVADRKLIMVFLDSAGKLGRAQDAERVRRWVEMQAPPSQAAFVRPQG
jgi:D-alanyl-D-alanine endopeptidase (penicillin-binding protein 7)